MIEQPALTRNQIRRVDQLAVARYAIPSLILMENAGRGAAGIIRATYGDTGSAVVCCGTGNNGGDGFVIARQLHNLGWSVRILLAGDRARLSNDAIVNFKIADAMELSIAVENDAARLQAVALPIRSGEVIVDALLGTGFRGAVRSPTAELIGTLNDVPKRAMVSVDVPSGLDCEIGEPSNATIRADLTITFVAMKIGFQNPCAFEYLGRVVVTDIGAPPELIALASAEE